MAHEQLCSEFVAVRVETARGRVVETLGILEEISATGATVQLERPVAIGDRLEVQCENCRQRCRLKGRVTGCRRQPALGHFAVVRFEDGTKWSPALYSPQHLLDPDRLVEESSAPGCCEPGPCANQAICRVLTPEVPLKKNVRIVGQLVARVCGGMDRETAANCFRKLFGFEAGCRLFDEFYRAYQRRGKTGQQPKDASLRSDVRKMARILATLPEEVAGAGGRHPGQGV